MKLNELLEDESIEALHQRTMISEENIRYMLAEDYTALSKIKVLGFLSIFEREYQLDVLEIRNHAIEYFESQPKKVEAQVTSNLVKEEKKGKSALFYIVIFSLLGYASWYFITQFDKQKLNTYIPFLKETNSSEKKIDNANFKNAEILSTENNLKNTRDVSVDKSKNLTNTTINNVLDNEKDIKIENPKIPVVESNSTDKNNSGSFVDKNSSLTNITNNVLADKKDIKIENQERPVVENNVTKESNITNIKDKQFTEKSVMLIPVKSLWFGLINLKTNKKNHYTEHGPFRIDLNKGDWLLATSPAPFFLEIDGQKTEYNNGKVHYFKISKKNIKPLSKKQYVAQGGYKKW